MVSEWFLDKVRATGSVMWVMSGRCFIDRVEIWSESGNGSVIKLKCLTRAK